MNNIAKKAIIGAAITGIYSVLAIILSQTLLPGLEKAATISQTTASFIPAAALLAFCYPVLFIMHVALGFLKLNSLILDGFTIILFTVFVFVVLTIIIFIKHSLSKPKQQMPPIPMNPQSLPPTLPQNPQV